MHAEDAVDLRRSLLWEVPTHALFLPSRAILIILGSTVGKCALKIGLAVSGTKVTKLEQ